MENAAKFTPFERELMIRTASSKGFRSVNEHQYHLMRQYPNWCGMLYYHYQYAKCEENEGKSSEYCAKMRRMLKADCRAVDDGGCLSFPDDSHLEYKEFSDVQIAKMAAELYGMSLDQFVRMKHKQLDKSNRGWNKSS